MRLLIRVVARTHHRADRSVHEAHLVGFFFVHLEGVGMHVAAHRQVVAAWHRYWPMVSMSTLWARMSRMTCRTSSSVSPRPTMMPDLVGVFGCRSLKRFNRFSEYS